MTTLWKDDTAPVAVETVAPYAEVKGIRRHLAEWPEAVAIHSSASGAAVARLLHRLQPWRTARRIARPRMLPD